MEYIVVGIFTALIVWCFVAGVRRPKLRGATPALLTTLGVLGTFVGIFIGLLDFNVQGIKESIPSLLDGLKIAFATSIIGMFAGVLFKVLSSLGYFGEEASQEEVGPGEIYDVLVDVREAARGQKDALGDLRKAIAGDSDDTLLTQLKNLRTEMGDNSKKLISEFQEFARKMAENNSQALIEALEKVMRDFSVIMNDLVGAEFKQLKEAVDRLVDWQKEYRLQIESATNNLKSSSESLTQIVEKTTALPKTLESLEPLLTEARDRIGELEAHLKAFATLEQKAQNAFPVIEDNLKQMTEGMADAVRESVHNSHTAVVEQTKAVEEQTEFVRQLRTSIQGTHASLEEEIKAALAAAVLAMGKRLGTLAEALGDEYEKVNKAVGDMNETIKRLNGRQ